MSRAEISRRKFEVFTILLMPLIYGAGILVGVFQYFSPFARSRRLPRLNVGPSAEFEAGKVWSDTFNRRLIWVFHDDGQIRAVDARCTHLKCNVNWFADEQQFRCPCHQGIFSSSGERVSGPPQDPLRLQPFEKDAEGNIILLDQEEGTT